MLNDFLSPQFRRFLVTGGIAAAVNLGARFVANHFVSYSVAIVIAYVMGMTTAFLLARRFVFTASSRTALSSAPRFVVVNLLGLAQTWGVSVALAEHVLPALGLAAFAHGLGHLAGVMVPAFTSYIGHRYWTFAAKVTP